MKNYGLQIDYQPIREGYIIMFVYFVYFIASCSFYTIGFLIFSIDDALDKQKNEYEASLCGNCRLEVRVGAFEKMFSKKTTKEINRPKVSKFRQFSF